MLEGREISISIQHIEWYSDVDMLFKFLDINLCEVLKVAFIPIYVKIFSVKIPYQEVMFFNCEEIVSIVIENYEKKIKRKVKYSILKVYNVVEILDTIVMRKK